jgi:putative IMPACT (imprinted ancient) family translation regulator
MLRATAAACQWNFLRTARRRAAHTLVARGEIARFKKCRFQAAVLHLDSEGDIRPALAEVASDRRVGKATHAHIAAWRVGEVAGFDDCGEPGAGQRLLQLLQSRDNVLVAVTRWYGGSHLGSARFRAISNCAKELLAQCKKKAS